MSVIRFPCEYLGTWIYNFVSSLMCAQLVSAVTAHARSDRLSMLSGRTAWSAVVSTGRLRPLNLCYVICYARSDRRTARPSLSVSRIVTVAHLLLIHRRLFTGTSTRVVSCAGARQDPMMRIRSIKVSVQRSHVPRHVTLKRTY